MEWMGKKVLVMGAGLSGSAMAQFLAGLGADVFLSDDKGEANFPEADAWRQAGITLYLGGAPKNPAFFDAAFISPGISPEIPLAQALEAAGVPIYGELFLVAQYSKARFIAITGTNGKTTTTALTGHILSETGKEVFVGGNIGVPLLTSAPNLSATGFVVAEISSFQLERPGEFAPEIAAVLNITPDHLDRHGDLKGYMAAKANIFKKQWEKDYLVLNYDDEYSLALASLARSQVVYFSRRHILSKGFCVSDGNIVMKDGEKTVNILPVSEIYIKGGHNIENALAAAAMTYLAGIPVAEIARGLRTFRGVAHRQEIVGEVDGVLYINDSKGTNTDSTIQALLAYDAPLILILGGYDKHVSFEPLTPLIRERVKAVVTMGATEKQLLETLRSAGYTALYPAGEDFKKAVETARNLAVPGDVVILSPACASWGMFRNFEERGDLFKEIVHKFAGEGKGCC